MVLPTKRNPRRFKSLLMASDSGVVAGMSASDRGRRCAGLGRKLPDVGIERAERVARLEERLGVRDGGGHLEPVADDPGVIQKAGDVVRPIARRRSPDRSRRRRE